VYEEGEDDDLDPRIFALVPHLSRALDMSVSSIKGYLERDNGQVIIKDLPTLKHLRGLGAIGLCATSAAIFPLDRLVQALARAKLPNKDLIKRISVMKMDAFSESSDLSLGGGFNEDVEDEKDVGEEKEEEEEDEKDGDADVQEVVDNGAPMSLTLEEVGTRKLFLIMTRLSKLTD
jgi:hypothetical protein